MNADGFLTAFFTTCAAALAGISFLGLSPRLRKRAETWLIPLLTVFAAVSVTVLIIYLFSAGV